MPQITIEVSDEQLLAVQYLIAHASPLENLKSPADWALRRLSGELGAAVMWYNHAFDQIIRESLDDSKNALKTRDELIADAKAVLIDPNATKKVPPPSEIPPMKPESASIRIP